MYSAIQRSISGGSTQVIRHKDKYFGSFTDRFTFERGIAMFDGIDLDLAEKRIVMLEKMVNDFGHVVPYTDFNKQYSSADPGTVVKDKSAIVKAFKKHKVPCAIEAKTGVGYLIRHTKPNASE